VRFILAVVEGRLVVNNRKKADLLQELAREGYELFGPQSANGGGSNGNEGEDSVEDATDLGKGYDYLLGMKLWNLTLEKVGGRRW
jgi:DNA topoisomerase II